MIKRIRLALTAALIALTIPHKEQTTMDRRKQISEPRNFGNPWLRWRVWRRLLPALLLVGLFTTMIGVPQARAAQYSGPEWFILYGDSQFMGSYVTQELAVHLRDLQRTSRTIKQVAFTWDARRSGWGSSSILRVVDIVRRFSSPRVR